MIIKALVNDKEESYDDRYDDHIQEIIITPHGVIICWHDEEEKSDLDEPHSTRMFLPWHKINLAIGQWYPRETHHELDYFHAR